MDAVCHLIPVTLEGVDLDSYGYHRQCYQRFHANLNRLKTSETSPETSVSGRHHSPRKLSSAVGADVCLFPPECIFCENLEIKASGKTERPINFASWKYKDSAWQQIEHQALELGKIRLHSEVLGKDLHAEEAQCHPYCRDKFFTEYKNHVTIKQRAANKILDTEQVRQAAAHEEAFNSVVETIQKRVVERYEVMQLSSLRCIYIDKLAETGYSNPEYRSAKLLHRLENHAISGNISFIKVSPGDKGCISFNLIYNNSITVSDAIAFAYKLGSTDKFADVALLIRGLIQRAYKESKQLPWPPTADDMEVRCDKLLPNELVRFLTLVMAGTTKEGEKNEKTQRLVLSIGQDLCHAVSDGNWKLPKHILLCSTTEVNSSPLS